MQTDKSRNAKAVGEKRVQNSKEYSTDVISRHLGSVPVLKVKITGHMLLQVTNM